MEQITQEQINALIENGILRNTREGIVNTDGLPAGFYKTRHKKYIEEKYLYIAKTLVTDKVVE